MIDYFKTKEHPITRKMILEAFQLVKTNKGASGIDGQSIESMSNAYFLKQRTVNFMYRPWSIIAILIVFLLSCEEDKTWIKLNQLASLKNDNWVALIDGSAISRICDDDSGHIWVTTYDGSILRSRDTGSSWQTVIKGDGKSINAITIQDSIFAIQEGGKLLTSLKSGGNCQVRIDWIEDYIHQIIRNNIENKLIVIGSDGAILSSLDEGKTWSRNRAKKDQTLNAICSDSSQTQIWIVGSDGTIIYSSNGGKSYQDLMESNDPLKGHYLTGVCCNNKGDKVWLIDTYGTVYGSTNNTNHWIKLSQVSGSSSAINYDSINDQLWICCDQTVYYSNDGGLSWTPSISMYDAKFNAIFYSKKTSSVWLGNSCGQIFQRSIKEKKWQERKPQSMDVKRIYNIDARKIIALTMDNLVIGSRDDGESWQILRRPKKNEMLRDICADKIGQNIWIIGDEGYIGYSKNGGGVWADQESGTTQNLSSICINEINSMLWAATDSGKILFYNKRDQQWLQQYEVDNSFNTESSVSWGYTVKCFGNYVWVTGHNGVLLSSKNQGASWDLEKIDEDIVQFFCRNEGKVIVALCNGDNSCYLQSRNIGDSNWTKESINDGEAESLTGFSDKWNEQLWVTGNENLSDFFGYSTDKGKNWIFYETDISADQIVFDSSSKKLLATDHLGSLYRSQINCHWQNVDSVAVRGNTSMNTIFLKLRNDGENRYCGASSPTFSLYIKSNSDKDSFVKVHTAFKRSNIDSFIYYAELIPGDYNVRSGEAYKLAFDISQKDSTSLNAFVQNVAIPAVFVYRPWQWVLDNKSWIFPLISYILILLILTIILLTAPLTLLFVYEKVPVKGIVENLPKPYNNLSKVIDFILPLKYFGHHPRVLDAWVRSYLIDYSRNYLSLDQKAILGSYTPLPIKEGSSASIIDSPSSEYFSKFFSTKRTVLEIIGIGGSGKTSLAFEIGCWCLAQGKGTYLIHHPCIPVFISTDISDLVQYLQENWKAWFQKDVDKGLFETLLKKQRILVIIDGLSEKSTIMQKYIAKIHGTVPVNSLIVTSRYNTDFFIRDETSLYTVALSSDKLLHFMTTKLNEREIKLSVEQGLLLGHRLAQLFYYKHTELPITPLLIKLALDRLNVGSAEISAEEVINNIPVSIPEIYFDYLRSLNPKDGTTNNRLSDEQMLNIASQLAKESLGEDFVPKEFALSEAKETLNNDSSGIDSIKRLVDNGVLSIRSVGVETFLKFNLDPIAEYLAAMAWMKKCRRGEYERKDLEAKIEALGIKAEGFRMALSLVEELY